MGGFPASLISWINILEMKGKGNQIGMGKAMSPHMTLASISLIQGKCKPCTQFLISY